MFSRLRRVLRLFLGSRTPVRLGLAENPGRRKTSLSTTAIQTARGILRLHLPRFEDPPWSDPTVDPLAGVRAPRRFGPGDRSSAVALDEPDDGPDGKEVFAISGRNLTYR
jgi:hypothetical protein